MSTGPVRTQTEARLAAIEDEQRQQRRLLEKVLMALTGDVTGERQGVHERLNEHEARLDDHGAWIKDLQDARERGHQSLRERLWQLFLGALLGAGGTIAGFLSTIHHK